MFHATAHLTARAASGNVRATGSLIRKRLLLAGAVATLAAGMSALAVTEEAGASLGTSYYASFPNALCEATSISFHAPTSVSPWAGVLVRTGRLARRDHVAAQGDGFVRV